MRKIKKNKLGFTLVEILVVMAIIAILATSSVVISARFNRTQNINIAYDNLKTTLSQAKSYALFHVITDCNAGVGRLVGYQVNFEKNRHVYKIQEVCQPTSGAELITDVTDEIRLPEGVHFHDTGAGEIPAIRFKVLTGGATSTSTITIKQGSKTKAIRVTTSGIIQNAN